MRRTRLVATLAVASAASASLLFAASATAADYPPGDGGASASTTSAPAGTPDTVSDSGNDPGEQVDAYAVQSSANSALPLMHLRLASFSVNDAGFTTTAMPEAAGRVFLGSAIASASGVARVTFTIPASLPAGEYSVELIGESSGHIGSTPLTVTKSGASTPSSSGSGLPFTGGNDVWQMTLAGVVLVGVGGSLLVVRRRRTHAAA